MLFWWGETTKNRNMKRKRRHLSAEFKSRVALEALKGIRTVNDIAKENEVAPTQVSAWKKELEDRVEELFASKGDKSRELAQKEVSEARLERKVGQLVIEKEFLEKKCKQLGIDLSEKP
jgi:transposase-like protein